MVAYHYWKCYHKESSAFQTASLYSIEVDYYHFGTCEIVGGSYFCGDHSCSTYKYIGDKNVVENPVNINDRFVQKQSDGLVGPPDNLAGQYQKLTGRWLNATIIANFTMMQYVAGAMSPLYDLEELLYNKRDVWHAYAPLPYVAVTPLHLQRNLYPGLCSKRCDEDATCKAYQESRWSFGTVAPECYLFHWPDFRSSYSDKPLLFQDTWWWQKEGDAATDQSGISDFYLAISKPKDEPWLHIPKTTSRMPHAPGFEAASGKSTKRDPIPPVSGRRLAGVY